MLTRYDETTLPSYELGWEAAERKYAKQVREKDAQIQAQNRELEQTKYQFAQVLLQENKRSLEEISSLTKLSLEQVKKLADKMASKDEQRH